MKRLIDKMLRGLGVEDKQQILTVLALEKPILESRFRVRSLALFGSYARGDQQPGSDVDILVDVDPEIGLDFVSLADWIEKLLGLPVDLVSSRAIKPKLYESIKGDLVYV